jgi:hypothetical protein
MKKLALILLTAFVAPAVMAQGKMVFQDFLAPDTLDDGTYIGADYTTVLWWGTSDDFSTFQPLESSSVAYYGATGGAPDTDGAGLFDGGTIEIPGQEGTVYVRQQIIGQDGAAQGLGSIFQIALATGATPPKTIPSEAVVVTIVPEPTSFALAGLGAAALMIFRRRK